METIKKYYIPIKSLNGGKENNLKVEVYYDLGGYSYFTGKQTKRGYYVSVLPVERSQKENCIVESLTLFVGYKHCLKEVSRKTNKASQEAISLSENIDWLIKEVCDKYNLELL